MVDADSRLEKNALQKISHPFCLKDTKQVIAVDATIEPMHDTNNKKNKYQFWSTPQKLEYKRFNTTQMANHYLGALTLLSGAFSMFDREIVIELGGFSAQSIGEDYELVLRIIQHINQTNKRYKIVNVPDAICWTQAPKTHHILKSQRTRWQQGALEGLTKYHHHYGSTKHLQPLCYRSSAMS